MVISTCWIPEFESLIMSKWEIRRANHQDVAAFVKSIDAAYSIYRTTITDLPDVSDGVSEDIDQHFVWVAEVQKKVVGGAILAIDGDIAHIKNIAIDPAFSGQGIGKALILSLENECKHQGVKDIRLSTHVDMPNNIKLYGHLDWTETGRSGNKVHMTKDIYHSSV